MPSPRFEKGNPGGPGRPKGSKTKVQIVNARQLQATANARATDLLETVLSKAHNVVDEALDDGNVTVAQWVIDRVLAKGGTSLLPEAIDIKLSSIDNVIEAAQVICEMVMLRKITTDDANKVLQMLSSYCSFRAFERLDELKEVVEAMQVASSARQVEGEATHLPTWGRLSQNTETSNKTPAE